MWKDVWVEKEEAPLSTLWTMRVFFLLRKGRTFFFFRNVAPKNNLLARLSILQIPIQKMTMSLASLPELVTLATNLCFH